VIFTNFVRQNCLVLWTSNHISDVQDMLHSSILPHEDLWRRCVLTLFWNHQCILNDRFKSSFLKSLKIVAVDELHYYSGLLGT
jgi:DEAD/DEAH box helicase domain-containing protein